MLIKYMMYDFYDYDFVGLFFLQCLVKLFKPSYYSPCYSLVGLVNFMRKSMYGHVFRQV